MGGLKYLKSGCMNAELNFYIYLIWIYLKVNSYMWLVAIGWDSAEPSVSKQAEINSH